MASPHIDDDEPGFFRRNLVMIILGGIVLAGGGYFAMNRTPSKAAPKRKMDVDVFVTPMPVIQPEMKKPEPQPKPVEPEEKKDDKMIVQEEVKTTEEKPQDKLVDKPADEPLGTAIGGGDGSGLGIGEGNGTVPGLIGKGPNGGSEWGWYAGQVQNRLADALRRHAVTKGASFSNTVKIWSDSTGRITLVKLANSTGDPKVDTVIENEVFKGLVLNEPPPVNMPMPINLRLTAR